MTIGEDRHVPTRTLAAFFFLGESRDPRALEVLEELIAR
jgi:hypothetical protein